MRLVIFETVVCRAHLGGGRWSPESTCTCRNGESCHSPAGESESVDKVTPGRTPLPGVFVRPLGRIPAPHLAWTPQMAQHESSRQRAQGLKYPRGSLLLHSRVIKTSHWGVRLSFLSHRVVFSFSCLTSLQLGFSLFCLILSCLYR